MGIDIYKGKFKKVRLIFVSGSQNFLITLANLLNNLLELNIYIVYKGCRSYRLVYSTSDSVKIFKYIYKDANHIFLRRKYDVFKKFFLEYNKWVDSEVGDILKKYGAMVK